jgi:hypothetical protein
MTKNVSLIFLGSLLFGGSLAAADQAAVVMDKDGKVNHLLVQPGPVTVSEVKESFHQIGEADPAFIPPPATPIVEPTAAPTPVVAEVKPVVSPASRVEIVASPLLSAPIPVSTLDFSAQKTNQAPVVRSVVQAVEPPLPQPLYEPNQNGVVVLPGRTRGSSEEGIANPFDIRLIAFKPVNELKIRVGGVVMGGDKPTAIVNGRPYSANDRWSGFNVVMVRRDSLLIERDGVFILIPRGRDISIKIPL